ncbi:MAG: alpha/beta fold hydrolase [Steroidobacteraceae bacterium]
MPDLTIDESFAAPRWLRNHHTQTVLASNPVRAAAVRARAQPVLGASRDWLIDCGDGVTLQAFEAPHRKAPGLDGEAISVLLHGWEGSADSLYVLSMAQTLHDLGHEVVRLNLRDHGTTHHLNQELFHSCRLAEVVGAVRAIAAKHRGRRLILIGFSLGGNFMLRVGAEAPKHGIDIARIVAISPVLDPATTMTALETGLWIYDQYFIEKWSRSLRIKQQAWPQLYDFDRILRSRSLRGMTDELVRAHTEYTQLQDYLAGYAITGSRLERLEMPATIVTSLDDPIIPAADLRRLAAPRNLEIIATRHGGHCGFLESLGPTSWIDKLVPRLINPAVAARETGPVPALQSS